MKLLMIADDFTGALDAGVQFAKKGFSTKVMVYSKDITVKAEDTDVLVVDAETRHKQPLEAYRTILQIVKPAAESGVSYFFKKTDSALRGNIGAELTAMLDATGRTLLNFVPAFPQMNRVTVEGIHFIDGVPVDESVFGSDPFEPVTTSNVEELIHQQCEISVQTIPAGNAPGECREKTIAVYNCSSDSDLQKTVTALKDAGSLGLIAGCAGLAEILPEVLGWQKKEIKEPVLPEKFLVVCGSVNPITVKQLDYAEKNGFVRIRLTPEQKLNKEYFSEKDGKEWLDKFWDICSRNAKVIIDTNDPEGDNETERYAVEHNISRKEVRERIPAALGEIIGNMVQRGLKSSMLMTGGDTLLGCMHHLGDTELTPVGEYEIGIVLSQLVSNNNKTHVFTKSGGFGEETLLTDMAAKICRTA